jgi:hemoglobin
MSAQTLFEKYGGFAAVSRIVHDFYDRIRESKSLARYFEHVEMSHLIRHQIAFLCKVMGGPDNYEGRALEKAHARLDISPEAFAEVAQLLQESVQDAGVEPADVATIMGVVAAARPLIVSAKKSMFEADAGPQ